MENPLKDRLNEVRITAAAFTRGTYGFTTEDYTQRRPFAVLTRGCERGEEQEDEHARSVVTFLKACLGLLYAELTFI